MPLPKSKILRAATLAALMLPTTAHAVVVGDPTVLPGSTQVGQPAQGSDMWTQAQSQLGLFKVHRDDCDTSTEVFVEVYTDDNSVAFGFCIDKDQHSDGTVAWDAARDACAEDGKRLPEPGEFQHVCLNTTGLNNLGTSSGEWATNFPAIWGQSSTKYGIAAPVMGPGCRKIALGWVGNVSSVHWGRPFRCVR